MRMGCTLYILRCADGSYYTGTTRGEDIATRVSEHNNGHFPDAWTAARRPVELVFSETFETITDAIAAERRIKGWSRAKKEALIAGRWGDLPWLARRRTCGLVRPTPCRAPRLAVRRTVVRPSRRPLCGLLRMREVGGMTSE
jgi:putative endonuclease